MITLKVEEYCHNCPDFEPNKKLECLHAEYFNNDIMEHEFVRKYETTISCKYRKRCLAQMEYLRKQQDIRKKETGDSV